MARFLVESRTLFQHVPRTGGTFVEEVIDQSGIQCNRWISKQDNRLCPKKHSLLAHYHRHQMALVDRVVCFVRHPVEYYSSVWRYLHDAAQFSKRWESGRMSALWRKWRWHPFKQAARLYRPDFAEWTEAVIESEPCWATRLMSLYVGPEDGEFAAFIGRTETLEADLLEVLERLGHRIDEKLILGRGRVNQSKTAPIPIPSELQERICREERVLIRRFYSPDTLDKRWCRRPPRPPGNARLPAPGTPQDRPEAGLG
jgi:hypothetical protein